MMNRDMLQHFTPAEKDYTASCVVCMVTSTLYSYCALNQINKVVFTFSQTESAITALPNNAVRLLLRSKTMCNG